MKQFLTNKVHFNLEDIMIFDGKKTTTIESELNKVLNNHYMKKYCLVKKQKVLHVKDVSNAKL